MMLTVTAVADSSFAGGSGTKEDALGGNDVVTSTYNDMMNLPIIKSLYV